MHAKTCGIHPEAYALVQNIISTKEDKMKLPKKEVKKIILWYSDMILNGKFDFGKHVSDEDKIKKLAEFVSRIPQLYKNQFTLF
jgi:hypothetical protein